jgi:hypothetical protein
MAGRKTAGYIQMLLAIAGFIVTVVALVRIVLLWARDFQLPADATIYSAAIIGMAVVLVSWCWSLLTSLALFREKP